MPSPLPRFITVLSLLVAGSAAAQELDFYRDIYPSLKANCIACHNKTTTKAGLDMETPEDMKKGGDSGPAILPGNGKQSLVVTASRHEDDMEMPPKNNKAGAIDLTPAEIAKLSLWIDQGAKASEQQERSVAWQALGAGVHPIYALAVTADGRYAACGRSNHIAIYDLATQQLVTELSDPAAGPGAAHRAMVQSLAFSPDGKRLASGSFREVKLWQLTPAKPMPLQGPAFPVVKAPTPAPAPAAVKPTPAPAAKAPAPVVAAAAKPAAPPSPVPEVSPDEALATKLAASVKTKALCFAFSADRKLIALGCDDGAQRVWEVASSKLVNELRGTLTDSQKSAQLDWTIAAQTLEQAYQKAEAARIEAQNKALDELLKKAREAIVAMGKVLPEKQKAVPPTTAAKAAAQKVVDDLAAALAKAEPTAKTAAEKALKDGQEKLLATTMVETSALSAVAVTQSNITDAEAEVKRISETHAANAKALAEATRLAAAAAKVQADATAQLNTVKQAIAKPTAKALAVAFSLDQAQLAAVLSDGSLPVWARASGQPIQLTPASKPTTAKAANLLAYSSGQFLAALDTGATPGTPAPATWKLERTLAGDTGKKKARLFADRVNALRFSPDGKLLAAGGGEPSRSGDIDLFDTATGKRVATWPERHSDSVLALDFSPDGKLLASGAADKIARVIEVSSGKQRYLFEGHTHHVTGISFRSDGRVVATAGADNVLISWDMHLGERKKKVEGWTKELTSAQFLGASNQLLTSAGDNRVRIVTDEGAEVRAIANLPDFMQTAAAPASGAPLIAAGEDSVLRVWDAAGKELASFKP